MAGKRTKRIKLKVKIAYSQAPDAADRLRRAFEILLATQPRDTRRYQHHNVGEEKGGDDVHE